jgi:hypothetical protein
MHSVVLNSRLLSLTAGKGKGLSALHEGYLTVWDSSLPHLTPTGFFRKKKAASPYREAAFEKNATGT